MSTSEEVIAAPYELVHEAVGRHCAVDLSCKLADGWASFRSRLLATEPGTDHVVIDYPESGSLDAPEFAGGEMIGVSFRRGYMRCMFSTLVIAAVEERLPGARSSRVLKVAMPSEIFRMQRRVFYRAPAPEQQTIEVHMHPVGETPEPDDAPRCYCGTLLDISAGGLSVALANGLHPRWPVETPVEVRLWPEMNEPLLTVTGRLRHCNVRDEEVRVGLQVSGLETSPEGRACLQRLLRICKQFQNNERERLGSLS
jgi:c-di-GMP-binding flagellar brake protein YcgR